MWLSRCAGASLAADKGEGNVLVVWDFDWSLVNENSDTFVLRELAPALTDEMKQLQAERPAIFGKGKWTALMDHLLTKLGEEHMVSRRQIEHCLEGIPVFVEVIQVVRELAGRGCEQRILSDANSVFIDEVLRAACLRRHFSAVATNFGEWEPYAREDHDDHATHNDDILRVAPYQPRDRPHGCPRCPENLCKGAVLDQWRAELRPRRVVYVGDGSGDFCPCLRLRASDTVCARSGYPLAKKLEAMKDDAKVLDARVAYWEDGAELARALRAAAN